MFYWRPNGSIFKVACMTALPANSNILPKSVRHDVTTTSFTADLYQSWQMFPWSGCAELIILSVLKIWRRTVGNFGRIMKKREGPKKKLSVADYIHSCCLAHSSYLYIALSCFYAFVILVLSEQINSNGLGSIIQHLCCGEVVVRKMWIDCIACDAQWPSTVSEINLFTVSWARIRIRVRQPRFSCS